MFSSARKEVLIKSIAQAIPVFSMSWFKLPRGIRLNINLLIQNFWWRSKNGSNKTHWVLWEIMCSPKFARGLRFQDFELFSLALLARKAWHVLQNPGSLSARILKAIYFPKRDLLEDSVGSQPSQVRRALIENCAAMKQG
jgi:hypothetical protein